MERGKHLASLKPPDSPGSPLLTPNGLNASDLEVTSCVPEPGGETQHHITLVLLPPGSPFCHCPQSLLNHEKKNLCIKLPHPWYFGCSRGLGRLWISLLSYCPSCGFSKESCFVSRARQLVSGSSVLFCLPIVNWISSLIYRLRGMKYCSRRPPGPPHPRCILLLNVNQRTPVSLSKRKVARHLTHTDDQSYNPPDSDLHLDC